MPAPQPVTKPILCILQAFVFRPRIIRPTDRLLARVLREFAPLRRWLPEGCHSAIEVKRVGRSLPQARQVVIFHSLHLKRFLPLPLYGEDAA